MWRSLVAVILLFTSITARAGQACTEKVLPPAEVRAALALALDLTRELNHDDARIALVARAGQDLSRYGLAYSHVGIAWRDHPRDRWTMVEELNQCGTRHSALFDDGLGNFFLDDMFAYRAKFVVPSPGVQRRIEAVLAAGDAGRMFDPHYNMIAYPWSTRDQNSNQWVLETLASALGPQVATRADAHAWLEREGYVPAKVEIAPLERLGASLFAANLEFGDQPLDSGDPGAINVVSAESVLDFVTRIDHGATTQVVAEAVNSEP